MDLNANKFRIANRHGCLRAFAVCLGMLLVLTATSGCRSWRESRAAKKPSPSPRHTSVVTSQPKPASKSAPRREPASPSTSDGSLRQVVSLFDQRPWLNLDTAGDRDPEGIQFRVFLVDGTTRGVHMDGMLHVEMYRIGRLEDGSIDRKLSADWHYHTSELATIRSNMLGDGYNLKLRWAEKSVAGTEIEVLTRFESADGESIRSGTKRLRVPKYSS